MQKETEEADLNRQEDLARAACAGDREAFGQLFNLLYPRVLRTVWGMLADESEAHDVTQEAWIKAWERRGNFNFQSSFSTWIHRIAINAALDSLRRRKRLRNRITALFKPSGEGTAHEPASAQANPDRALRNKELGRLIEAAVAGLPEEQRTVLVLREYEGYSYEEIANLVGCKPGTVMSRLHLARTKLQARLQRDLS
jgi:RNA polymerase sigma-70 factor (ECF subfamily)